jgi:riboflavin kinase/FMN adenylyltransferase
MLEEEILNKHSQTGLVLTIGNFDGVHLGHQKLLKRVKALSLEYGWSSVAVTFQDHTSVLLRNKRPPMLMSVEERCIYFGFFGIDACLLLEFSTELAQMTPERFLDKLVNLGAKALVVGHDFTFGAGGTGDINFLQEYAEKKGIYVEVIPPVKYKEKIVCSSQIRGLLTEGKLAEANGMLNRPFSLSGKVEEGDGRGRDLGFPTANLSFPTYRLLPKFGVYLVRVLLGDEEYYGLANVGCKPTFNRGDPLVEVYIYNFAEVIYGDSIIIEFLKFLREERKFSSPDKLKEQMRKDKRIGEQLLPYFKKKNVN